MRYKPPYNSPSWLPFELKTDGWTDTGTGTSVYWTVPHYMNLYRFYTMC